MDRWYLLIFFVTLSTSWKCSTGVPHSPPFIVKEPPTGEQLFQVANQANENSKPFIIECEAEGEPTPTYRWIKNGKEFKYQTYDDRISQQPGRGTLVIKVPREEDIGQYQCFASNEYGVATSNSVFLRRAELNFFKEENAITVTAKEGQPFHLDCHPPDGWPKPHVNWILRDIYGSIRTIENSRMTVDPEGTLWFSNVTKEDAYRDAFYQCTAASEFRGEIKIGTKIILKVESSGSSQGQTKVSPRKQYVSRKSQVAYRDKTMELYCIYGGTPLPGTVWKKNGKDIRTSDRVTQGNFGKSLKIKHVNADDEGEYSCYVTNGIKEESHSMNVIVHAAPYFTEAPQRQTKAEGETAEFRCYASGNPEPQILWIYNGKPISEAPPNNRRKVSTNSIIIEKLEKSDTGNYGCNATNSLGYVYKDVYVNVLAQAPEFEEAPQNETIVDGRDVNITCRVAGSPRPQIKWIRNGVELTGGRYTILPTGDLHISNVAFGDMGNYTCYAENKLASINASATLFVKQRTQIKPGSGPIDFEVKAGDQATFRCAAEKDESLQLNIDWKRNGVPINFESEPRFVLTNDFSLTITKTTELDSGEYTCVASTNLDEATASAMLIVQDRPNPPAMKSVACYQKEALVSWTSKGENRAPILNYVIQYNTTFTPDTWENAFTNVPSSKEEFSVPITPWANYTFRVLARNKVGLSDPSLHSPIMCSTAADVPYKNPDNVMGKGTGPNNLVISWTPMSPIEHHAPHFYYFVEWRRNLPGLVNFEHAYIREWQQSEHVVINTPTFVEFVIKVTAFNERGQASIPAKEVIGYSGEDVPLEPPRNLSLGQIISATTASISWMPVSADSIRGQFMGYKIQMWPEYDSQKGRVQEIIIMKNITQTIINKLTPNAKNLVRVLAFNGKYNSPPSEDLTISTPEGVPDAVQSLDVIPLGSSAFLLMWKPPLETNGVLTGYKIYYQTVHGTELGPLQERSPQVNDPNRNQAKLAGLETATNYRISINATTRAGEGKTNYVEKRTRGTSSVPPAKPDFQHYIVETNMYATVRIQWMPCGREYECYDKTVGSHFYVKYKLKGAPMFEQIEERNEDFVLVRALQPNEIYLFSVVSMDGDLFTESDLKEIETYATATMKPREHMATAGWFVAMMLAIAFLIVVLILVCMVKRNRGGKYVVHEREAANGRHDFPDEPGFHEYSQPLGGSSRTRDSMHGDKKPSPESDEDSMAEFAEGDTARFTEDGSFIGQYGQTSSSSMRKSGDPQSPSAIATYV